MTDAVGRQRRWKAVGCGCCAGFLLDGFLCVAALVVGTRPLARRIVADDITEYVRLVEQADIDASTRDALLDQLERIRAHARRGDVGFFSWLGHEDSLEDLVDDGTLTDRDAAAFKRELDRLEAEIETGSGAPTKEQEPAPKSPLVRAKPGRAKRALRRTVRAVDPRPLRRARRRRVAPPSAGPGCRAAPRR